MFVEEYLADLRRQRYGPAAWIAYVRRCAALSREHAFLRPQSMRSLGITGVIGFVVLLMAAVAISLLIEVRLALVFFRNTGLTLLAGLLWMTAHVKLLRRSDDVPLPRLNAANVLTLSRLVAIPAILAFMNAGLTHLALTTFILAALTDVLDGWLARRFHDATQMGRVFDPLVDILFNAAVMVALHDRGYVPTWVLALVLTRYGLLLFGAAAVYIFRGPVEVKPTVLGKATGVVATLLVFTLVGGSFLLPPGVYPRISMLLAVAIGFVEAITIPQVILIGVYNVKRAGLKAHEAALHLIEVAGRDKRA